MKPRRIDLWILCGCLLSLAAASSNGISSTDQAAARMLEKVAMENQTSEIPKAENKSAPVQVIEAPGENIQAENPSRAEEQTTTTPPPTEDPEATDPPETIETGNSTSPPTQEEAAPKEPQEEDKEGGGSGFIVPLVLVAMIAGGLYYVKSRFLKNASGFLGGSPGRGDFGSVSGGSSSGGMHGRSSKNQEMVPLASAEDDEEWGWEDSSTDGGDTDLAKQTTRNDEGDDDMQFAMGSVGRKGTLSGRSTQPSPPLVPKRESSGGRTGSWPSPVAPAPSSAPGFSTVPTASVPSIPPMQITSLGKSTVAKKKPVKKQPAGDDIFASMGLAAKPTFTKPTVGRSAALNTTRGTASSSSNWKTADDVGAGTWDDDGDLDDLLDD